MLIMLLFYILIIPLCILMHEVGHGMGVILTSKSHAIIYLGNNNKMNKENFRIGRFHFHLQWSYFGFCTWEGSLDKRQRIASLAGGPIVSLLLATTAGSLMIVTPPGNLHSVLQGTTIFNVIQFFITAIPMTYPRWMGLYSSRPSDGLQLLRLLRNNNRNSSVS